MKWRLAIPLALLFILLAACSRGSRGPTAPAEVAPSLVELQSVGLVNETRSARQIEPLGMDASLAEVARLHSVAMREQGFVAHSGPGGGTLRDRLRAAGVSFRAAGENLAQVQSAVDPAGEAHAQLLESPGHRHNLLDPRFKLVGVGVARDGGTYWITQIFIDP